VCFDGGRKVVQMGVKCGKPGRVLDKNGLSVAGIGGGNLGDISGIRRDNGEPHFKKCSNIYSTVEVAGTKLTEGTGNAVRVVRKGKEEMRRNRG
jgi:hypothetical protein